MQPYLEAQAATGESGVTATGVAQEYQRPGPPTSATPGPAPQHTFAKADRPMTCCSFYLWDEDFRPAFVKVCACFPCPAKIWVNGHEWAKREALVAGIERNRGADRQRVTFAQMIRLWATNGLPALLAQTPRRFPNQVQRTSVYGR